MPAKSSAQYRFMQKVANDSVESGVGPSKKLAKEFIKKTPSKKRKIFSKKD